jgi:hypothetical protein
MLLAKFRAIWSHCSAAAAAAAREPLLPFFNQRETPFLTSFDLAFN